MGAALPPAGQGAPLVSIQLLLSAVSYPWRELTVKKQVGVGRGGARKETRGLTDQKSRQGSGYSPQAGPRRSLEKIRGQQHEDGVLKQHNLGHQKESQHAWPGAGGLGTLPSRDLLQLPSGLGALSSCPRGLPLLTGPSWKQGQSRVSLSSNGGFSLFSVQLIKITAES